MKVFLPQGKLEQWILEEQLDLEGDFLIVAGRRFPVEAAVHVVRTASGADAHQLVSRVKARAQLEGMGAEVLNESMLVGEVAYDVDPGFIVQLPEDGSGEAAGSATGRPGRPGGRPG